MTDRRKIDEPTQETERLSAQIESVIDEILSEHPQLRAARNAARQNEEATDKFAKEFLRVFRQRLEG